MSKLNILSRFDKIEFKKNMNLLRNNCNLSGEHSQIKDSDLSSNLKSKDIGIEPERTN